MVKKEHRPLASDYSISQFSFLEKLILYHGRLGYRRISLFVMYYFYKNILIIAGEILFVCFSSFSGSIFFPNSLPIFYNALWTSWPCIIAFGMDKDLPVDDKHTSALLYKAGQARYYFTLKKFWSWVLSGFFHGLMVFSCVVFSFSSNHLYNGSTRDSWFISTLIFTISIHISVNKLFLSTNTWSFFTLAICFSSILFYYLCLLSIDITYVGMLLQKEIAGKVHYYLTDPYFIMFLVIVPIAALLPDIIYLIYKRLYILDPVDLLLYQKQCNSSAYLLEEENSRKISVASSYKSIEMLTIGNEHS